MMDVAAEVEENLFAVSDAKLHGQMCKALSIIYCKVLSIFPSLEAARPRSKTGIQALCSLHVALEKAKNVLHHCSVCSKLYLAVTGDSVLLKFEKAKCALEDSLRRVEDIVPQSIGCQVQEIVNEFADVEFALDPLEKQVGDDLIALLQQGKKFDDDGESYELESFHQAATRLGITSSRVALAERRALKKLIDRARAEEDKRKESIVAYLLHLMRKYSKLFRNEFSDDTDSQGSGPCSPTVQGSIEDGVPVGHNQTFERQLSKLSSFNFKPNNNMEPGQMALPPEELRCPISLQLMYDPVIIASGQTYEKVCIEKWFGDGHINCPKTQQNLPHLYLTPNYCVKGLVASWCEQNGIPIPEGPPESLDLNYWRLVLSESESTNSRSVNSVSSCKLKGVKVVPLEERCISEEYGENGAESSSAQEEDTEQYLSFLKVLTEGNNWKRKYEVVEQLRLLLRDDEEARIFMGANGFVQALVQFLQSAVHEKNLIAQESGAMALFNLAVNNDRNKEIMLSAGVLSLLEEMISNTSSYGCATALYLNLSCLEEAKPMIGMSQAVQFLTQLLQSDNDIQYKQDSLHALYNLSTVPSNIPYLLSSGIVNGLQSLLVDQSDDCTWTEKCIAVLINLATSQVGREEMVSNPGLISALASILDTEELEVQEQAVSCLLILCNRSEQCSDMVLQEGVIPALVSISVNGTPRGREKAQKLLMLFRQQRRDESSVEVHQCPPETSDLSVPPAEMKPLCKWITMLITVKEASPSPRWCVRLNNRPLIPKPYSSSSSSSSSSICRATLSVRRISTTQPHLSTSCDVANFDPLGINSSSSTWKNIVSLFESSEKPRGGGGGAAAAIEDSSIDFGDFFKGPLPGKFLKLLGFLVLSRLGVYIPLGGVNREAFLGNLDQNSLLSTLDSFSGGGIGRLGICSLGIVPFINAQIVFQLLAQVYPKLQDLQKREGEAGRKKILQYTRYASVGFAIVQAIGQVLFLRPYVNDFTTEWALTSVILLTLGSVITTYIGEQITDLKLGNGTSLLIFTNIISYLPASFGRTFAQAFNDANYVGLVTIIVSFFLLVVGIVYVQEAERKIPINYASRFTSKSGGLEKSAYLPFKVNSSGVMPIIFSTSSLALPGTLARFTGLSALKNAAVALNPGGSFYLPFNILLIAFFNYYYTFLQLDPDDVSEQLKRQGASIPLVRPGRSTATFIKTVLSRISVLGSTFLAILAAGPAIVEQTAHLTAFRGFAGTSILILVGCATDTARKVRAEIISQKYKNIELYDFDKY